MRARAIRATSSTSRDLPIPASPTTSTSDDRPATAELSRSSNHASSAARPKSASVDGTDPVPTTKVQHTTRDDWSVTSRWMNQIRRDGRRRPASIAVTRSF